MEEWPRLDDTRNWTEDYAHENGEYMNNCIQCNRIFFGHKRRRICKECATGTRQVEL